MTDKLLIKLAKGFKRGCLDKRRSNLMCFAISAPLHSYLRTIGVDCELIEYDVTINSPSTFGKRRWQHFCIKLKDGRILDATIDQFRTPENLNLPDIYLGKRPEYYKEIRKQKENAYPTYTPIK